MGVLARREPDFGVLFSSNSSVLGGFGFGAYAAGNSFLDQCAGAWLDPRFQWLCTNWDRFSDQASDGEQGRYTIGFEEALDALWTILSRSTACQVIIADSSLRERRERSVMQRQRPARQPQRTTTEEVGAAHVPPRTQLELTIVQVWQEVLGGGPIGVQDSFFELGGDSLIGLRILARLREIFQVEIPLKALLGPRPTVASLVRQLVTELQHAARPM